MFKKVFFAAAVLAASSSGAMAGFGGFSPPSFPSHPTFPSFPFPHHSLEAPEIDPSSAVAGLTLLAGGIAVMFGRRSKRLQTQA